MTTKSYKKSKLNDVINIKNFSTGAICITDFNLEIVNKIHGLKIQNFDEWFELYQPKSASMIEIIDSFLESNENTVSEEVYQAYGKGHWINEEIYNNVKVLLIRAGLSEHVESICIILMIQRWYMRVLEKTLPKFALQDCTAIISFSELLGGNDNHTTLKLSKHSRIIGSLSTSQTQLVSSIIQSFFLKNVEGQSMLKNAQKKDDENRKNHDQMKSLPFKNNKRMREVLRSKLIRNLFHAMGVKIPGVADRTLLIGQLMTSFGWFEDYSLKLSKRYDDEKDYYHTLLKPYIK